MTSFARRTYIGAPVEEVWPWLVEPELVERYALWLLEERPAATGDRVRCASRLGGQLLAEGEVLEIVEGRKLVHTFRFQLDPPEETSRVSLELLRYGDEMCCLELRHEELDPEGQTLASVSTSWDVALSSLKTLLETGRPLPWPERKRQR
jgi:uncharacterized protein YndB with AHSA1/START domain